MYYILKSIPIKEAASPFEGESIPDTLLELTGNKRKRPIARMRLMDYELNGAPGEIRTPGLLVRSQTLYPAELRAHTWVAVAT